MSEEMHYESAVNRISSEPVGMPCNDPVRFTGFNKAHHFVEHRSARLLGCLRFGLSRKPQCFLLLWRSQHSLQVRRHHDLNMINARMLQELLRG